MNEVYTIYYRIYDDIRQKIRSGYYKKGEKLPSVPDLCDIYDSSDLTIRKSLEMLKEDGYVYSERRVGVFVADGKKAKSLMHLNENLNIKFQVDSVEILSINNAGMQAHSYDITCENIIRLERMSYSGVLPVMYSVYYICSNSNNQNVYKKTHWAETIDQVFDGYFIKTEIIIEMSNDLEIKKKLFLADSMGMFQVTTRYFDKENKIHGLSEKYVSGLDMELNIESI